MEPYKDVSDITTKSVNKVVRKRVSSYQWYQWFLERFPLLENLLHLLK